MKYKVHSLRYSAAAFAALMLAAGPAWSQDYKEAPALAEMVKEGKLPPVAERLPKAPMVVQPFEGPGQYGGTWRLTMASASDIATLARTIGYENLTRWETWQPGQKQDDIFPKVEMNVAEAVDVNPEATEYTFKLRQGMKWSDGQPFTADDVMFWYEDVYSNSEVMPTRPAWSVRDGKPVVVEKIDDYTVKFMFVSSNAILLQSLSDPPRLPEPNVPTAYPRHYLKQFHIKYNPDADQQARSSGAQNWVSQFNSKADAWRNPEVPRLNPWIISVGIGQGSGNQVVAKRNPYYFKTDPQGNQLPYIDSATIDIISDPEVTLLKSANGDFDMVDSYIGFVTTPENKGTFFDNQERGNYDFYEVIPNRANLMILSLNMTSKDEAKREMFGNKQFRAALSTAINRNEIIELVWLGQGLPYQTVERPESPLFDEEMATQFTNYDPAEANRMLDEAGYEKRNGEGIRLDSKGRPITFTVDISVLRKPWVDAAELIRKYWRDVGVNLLINTSDNTALNQRVHNNDHDAAVWSASGGADTIFDPKYYLPYSRDSFFATAWGQWYSKGRVQEEPPEDVKKQMETYSQIVATTDPAKRLDLMRQVMQVSKEKFYTIGIMQPTTDYGIINRRLKNVPKTMMASTIYAHPGSAKPEQFFFTQE